MTLIDTHTHLYLPEFDSDRTEVMTRAINAGVAQMILPNVDCTTIAPMRQLHGQYPDITHMAMGLHPTEVGERWRNDIKTIATQLKTDDFIAVGEIGIDLYWDKTYITQQMEAFEMQVEWAAETGSAVKAGECLIQFRMEYLQQTIRSKQAELAQLEIQVQQQEIAARGTARVPSAERALQNLEDAQKKLEDALSIAATSYLKSKFLIWC